MTARIEGIRMQLVALPLDEPIKHPFMGARTQSWLSSASARRIHNRLFGGVLMFMGTSFLLVRRGV